MSDATERLAVWIRDYGDLKEPVFVADLMAVLAENAELTKRLELTCSMNRDLATQLAAAESELLRLQAGWRAAERDASTQQREAAELRSERDLARKAILAFGNNPAGFDWAFLARFEELETEAAELRELVEELCDKIEASGWHKSETAEAREALARLTKPAAESCSRNPVPGRPCQAPGSHERARGGTGCIWCGQPIDTKPAATEGGAE